MEIKELPHLLKLLDDETPEVQEVLKERFKSIEGDLSNEIAAMGVDLTSPQQENLSQLLRNSRRERLKREWLAPSKGWRALENDWESFECFLRQISDYLHDGVTLRPSLPDALDLLAEEADKEILDLTPDSLRRFLFVSGRYSGNTDEYYASLNSDLTWVIDEGKGNPISLSVIYMLVAQRLNLEVSACNYPGHFLARVYINGELTLVDCYNRGRLIPVAEVMSVKELSPDSKSTVLTEASPGEILRRILNNLLNSFQNENRTDDYDLISKLIEKF